MRELRRRFVASLALLWVLVPSAFGLDPEQFITQYGVSRWTWDQSLPALSIRHVVQGADGYIWMAGSEGLIRFDGVRFRSLNTGNSKLPENGVTALWPDGDGSLWLGLSKGGLCRLREMQFTCLGTAEGLPEAEVRSIARDGAGTLWFTVVGDGLYSYAGGKIRGFTQKEGLPGRNVIGLLATRQDSIWLSSFDAGAMIYDKHGHFAQIGKPVIPSNLVWSIAEDQAGAIWLATFGGLCRFRNALDRHPRIYTKADGLPSNNVTVVHVDGQNQVWVSTENGGLSRLEGGRFTTLTVENGLADRTVFDLADDREGDLWVGANGGLNRLRTQAFSMLDHRQGLADDSARTVTKTGAGDLVVGTYHSGLTIYRGARLDGRPEHRGLAGCSPLATKEDHAGTLWVGCAGGTVVAVKPDGGVRRFPLNSKNGFVEVNALEEMADGKMLAGTFGLGVVEFRNDRWKARCIDPAAVNVVRVQRAADGTLWVLSFDKGLTRMGRDGRMTSFAGRFGKEQPLGFNADADGTLWVITSGGMAWVSGEAVAEVPLAGTALDGATFYNVMEDGRGKEWLTSSRGIFAMARSDLTALAEGKKVTPAVALYRSTEGVTASNEVGWAQPTACRTRDGHLWFATSKGVLTVDPARLPVNRLAPPVYVETVYADDHLVSGDTAEGRPLRIMAREHRLEVQYAALSLVAPEKVRFRYRLEGVDPDWIDAGNRRSAFYTDLRPGAYRFAVRAANNDGVWSEGAASILLTKEPFYYQTNWFRLACLATALAMVWLVYRRKMQAVRKQTELIAEAVALEKQKSERERWAELARANQVLRRSATKLTQSAHPDEFIASFLREVMQLSGASAGAYFRRIGEGTEFAFALLIEGEREWKGSELAALPCAAEKRNYSRSDPSGYYAALLEGKAMGWQGAAERAKLPPLSAAYHVERGHEVFWEFPLSVGDEVTGSVGLAFRSHQGSSEIVLQTLDALNCQLAIAMEVTRLTDEKRATEVATENERAVTAERARIAREIHDTLAQDLSGILIQLRAMRQATDRGEYETGRLHADRALELAQAGLQEARQSLASLRPRELNGHSLREALGLLAETFERRSGVKVRLSLAAEVIGTPEQETELLRITQESVTNAVKHSGAQEIEILLRGVDQRRAELCVKDNGRGFDPEAPSEGFGLLGMKERASRIHAELTIQTGENGTTVCVRFPNGRPDDGRF